MSKIKIFSKKDCTFCAGLDPLIHKLKEQKKQIEHYDLDTDIGLAEASFYTVLSTPTIIITNPDGNEICSWRGHVPHLKSVLEKC